MIAATRIDRAEPSQLAVFERNLKKALKQTVSLRHAIIPQMLLNRVHCRQQEWAERNWLKKSVQNEFLQTLEKAKINPPTL